MNNRAQVLIIILWILGFLSVAALGLSQRTSTELKVVKYRLEEINTRAAAKSALILAEAVIREDNNSYGALNEAWSNGYDAKTGRYLFKDVSVGKVKFDISRTAEDAETPETIYGLADEEGKLNINTSEAGELTLALQQAALDAAGAASLAQAIVDFRRAQNKDFSSLEQLLRVEGMARAVFDRIKPMLTCFGAGRVNLNTAPRRVLSSLGMSDSLVNKIEAFRNGPDKKNGTSDDAILKTRDEILAVLPSAAKLTNDEQQLVGVLVAKEKVDVVSTAFTARIIINPAPGKRPQQYECTFGRVNDSFGIFYWQG